MGINKTNTEYVRRINLAIEYIHKHIDQPILLEDVAKSSYFSAYHFHRIFHGIVAETVNNFITRKKMERAAHRIVCKRELSITDISELGGFSSSANFAKAFKSYFGFSASQLRNPDINKSSKIGKIYRKYGKEFDPQSLYSQFVTNRVSINPDKLKEYLMNVKIEQYQERRIAYLTAPDGYELTSIFNTWDRLSTWAESNQIENHSKKRYAICHDNPMITPIDKCRYDASIEIDDKLIVNAPFAVKIIPAGEYAVAYYKGENVSNFYMELYSHWLPTSGFEPDDYPTVAHYLNDSRQDGFVEMEAIIKIKTLKIS